MFPLLCCLLLAVSPIIFCLFPILRYCLYRYENSAKSN